MEADVSEQEVTHDDLIRAKRAIVVLSEVTKTALGGKDAPLELRQDVQTLIRIIRVVERRLNSGRGM